MNLTDQTPTETAEQPVQTEPVQTEQQDQPAAQPTEPVEYSFEAPEGVTFDEEVLGEFKEHAKSLGLDQENAQKLAGLGVKLQQKWADQQQKVMETTRQQWVEQANADKEFGGEKMAENLSVAKKALDTFGTPELRQLLNDSGLGNHPEIIRAFYRAGKQISQDRFVGGGNGPSGSIDPAKVLFPNMS